MASGELAVRVCEKRALETPGEGREEGWPGGLEISLVVGWERRVRIQGWVKSGCESAIA